MSYDTLWSPMSDFPRVSVGFSANAFNNYLSALNGGLNS